MKKVTLMAMLALGMTLFSGLAFVSGCASVTGKTAGELVDDASITTEANQIIVKDQDAKFLKIDVSSTTGKVVLAGFIHDRSAEARIVAKIKQIRGVKSVESNLTVEVKK
ncbi:MAG: BON domain-containing protein [Nitrospinae bacterium]|nr:BON domain-containing protein [Nitrospinota bacterium]MBF0634591.1 BON domain-containing protein [Nitrospinota bacterium]